MNEPRDRRYADILADIEKTDRWMRRYFIGVAIVAFITFGALATEVLCF